MEPYIRNILLLLSLFTMLNAEGYQAVEKFNNSDGTQRIRVHLNYLNPNSVLKKLNGSDGRFNISLPIPNKWKLLGVSGYIKYRSSLLMLKNHSAGTILLNDIIIDQFKLFEHAKVGIKFEIDPLLFREYNRLTFQAIQHYTLQCEDPASNQLWTLVNLKESYIDFLVRPKAIYEEISSFKTALFDQKQYEVTPLNFVISDKSNKALKNYALFTAVASTQLKYRVEKIKASPTIDKSAHNVIIAPKEKARKLLKGLKGFYIFDKKPTIALHFHQNDCNKSHDISQGYLHLDGRELKLSQSKLKGAKKRTIAFWMRSNAQEGEKSLVSTNTFALTLSDTSIAFRNNAISMQASATLNDSTWHHIVATISNDTIEENRLYIDGEEIQLIKTKSTRKPLGKQDREYFIVGGNSSDNEEAFVGDIGQVYIFKDALSDRLVHKLYRISSYHRKHHMSDMLFIDEKISHDINIIQNPYNTQNAIVVIAPTDTKKIEASIEALYKSDLLLYTREGLDINQTIIPTAALPYTAKKFLPLNKKIYFKELGYKTKLLKGEFPPKINLDFKVYPDNYFDNKDKIKLHIRYIFPAVIRYDSVANIYLNENFAKQINVQNNAKTNEISIDSNKLFDWNSLIDIPAYLVGKGFNRLQFDFSLVPEKDKQCGVFNMENLVATVLDDSYFILPKVKKWIEMPYMQLIANAAYPYSIYPDLQHTTILFTNKEYSTIAASMNFIFFLTQQIDSYPYYLNISEKLDQKTKASQIIAFGTINDKLMENISQNAPMTLNETTLTKRYPFIENFVEHKGILDKSRNKKYLFKNSTSEDKSVDSNLVLQMLRSPYDKKKTIVMAMAESNHCLDEGIFSLLQQKNRGKIKGDLLIYDYRSEEAKTFDVKDKYILSDLNWIDTISLIVGSNPLLYIGVTFLILLIITYLIRQYLLIFKEEHHKDEE